MAMKVYIRVNKGYNMMGPDTLRSLSSTYDVTDGQRDLHLRRNKVRVIDQHGFIDVVVNHADGVYVEESGGVGLFVDEECLPLALVLDGVFVD